VLVLGAKGGTSASCPSSLKVLAGRPFLAGLRAIRSDLWSRLCTFGSRRGCGVFVGDECRNL
jgi:hypothetical protein